MRTSREAAKGSHALPSLARAVYEPLSRALKVNPSACTLEILDTHGKAGSDEWHLIRLGNCWLPDPAGHGPRSSIAARPDVFWTIAAALDSYLSRRKQTKSTPKVAAHIVQTLVKTYEYASVRGYFRLSDLPASEWTRLREELAGGGWIKALEIERRTVAFMELAGEGLAEMIRPDHTARGGQSVRNDVLKAMATNIYGRELASVKAMLLQGIRCPDLAKAGALDAFHQQKERPMGVGALGGYLSAINTLADAAAPYGLTFIPMPQARRFAVANGGQSGRTSNITPEQLAALLTCSYKWILEYGPLVRDLVRTLSFHVAALHQLRSGDLYTDGSWRLLTSELKKKILSGLEEKKRLEQVLGLRIDSLVTIESRTKGSISLYAVLNRLYSACFTVLSLMNARRKDEVLGSSIGLHAQSMRILDADLQLAECEFYIEKTINDYVPFFINRISQEAVSILRDISEIAWDVAEASGYQVPHHDKSRKLFVYPNFANAKQASKPIWYRFSAIDGGQALGFVREAYSKEELVIRPHMFRRAYGVVYIYRYELAELISLSQKYEHRDPAMTLIYVTDAESTPAGKTLAASWALPKESIRKAHLTHRAEVEGMVAKAGSDRLKAFVREVVDGCARYSGGFVRIVDRFHSRLQTRLDYSALEPEAQAQVIFKSLSERGHSPYPLRLNTCMAGEIRKRAACRKDGVVARENASPQTCCACPYSAMSRTHLDALRTEERRLADSIELMKDSVLKSKSSRDLVALTKTITLHSRRLESHG